jgi:hypothetical protein
MGTSGQYKQEAKYTYGNEKDTTPKPLPYESKKSDTSDDDIFVPEKIIEHISEDEKSTSSEEVMFEEWTEEFNCRRTDEYDGKTNKLIRTTIDETSDRIKSDVLKEEYKEKNTRIKGHKSYDIVKEVYRRAPTHIYEEIPKPPPPPTSLDRHWTSEEIYTTEFVQDPNVARELELTAQKFESSTHYDHIRSSQYSPIPSTRYERTTNVITPTSQYADKRKQEQEQEEVVSEEYHVEFETPIKREGLSSEDSPDQKIPTKQTSDWRDRLKQIYSPPSDDDQVN